MHRLPPWYPTKPHPKFSHKPPSKTQVAIIGGGITGTSTAYHLSRAGIQCTLIEKNLIGSGASSKNLGMITPGTEHDFSEAIDKFGRKKAKAYWTTTIKAIDDLQKTLRMEGIGNLVQRTGHLNVALHPKDIQKLRNEHNTMRKAGLESEWLEGNSIKKRINSPAVLAGIRVPYTCSLHPPTKLMQGLAHAAHQEGAKISEKTRVIHAKNNKLITTKGTVIADKIVIATEGYTPRGWMPYHLHTRQDTALATKPLPKKWFEKHWKGNELLWNYGVHYCAFKKSPDGRVYLFASEGARKGFAEFFPDTKISATHKWNCRVAGYKDQLPRIGKHPGMKNTYFGSGYRGHGLVYGFLAGKIITDLITGRKNKNAQLFKP